MKGCLFVKKGGFFKTNWAYLTWLAFYLFVSWLVLGSDLQSLWITVLLYAVSISIALTGGEYILRYIQGLRRLMTREEHETLGEIFKEVYQEAKEKYNGLNSEIELFISDKMIVNAFAMGRKTIVLTKGAITTFSRDELKGILAHEFGHHANGDTKALLLNTVGNGIFTLLVIAFRIFMFFATLIMNAFDESGIMNMIMKFFRWVFDVMILILLGLGDILLALNSRKSEFWADRFASDVGFNAELIDALKILEKITTPSDVSLLERLQASHPHLAERVARLEGMQEQAI